MKRIAALVPNVLGVAPGQRVRIELWAQHLQRWDWTVDFYPFEDAHLHEVLYRPGRPLTKVARLLSCYLRQLRRVLQEPLCDVLFIYREAALVGPALLERLAARRKVPIVYDVDDPIFVPYRSPMNGWFSLLKCPRKTHTLFRLSHHIISINRLIAEYATSFNPSVSVVPNCVDVEHYRPRLEPSDGAARIGWMGSQSTMSNLASIVEPLRRLQATHHTPLRVIGVGQIELPGVQFEVRQWSASTEVADLQDCDIGLVPLSELEWNRWKFFLKTVQYMAVGLPVVAQRMGSNSEVVQDGVNGFLVETQDEWYERLALLVTDAPLRRQMGAAARKTVVEQYSTQVYMPLIASLFERVWQRSEGMSCCSLP